MLEEHGRHMIFRWGLAIVCVVENAPLVGAGYRLHAREVPLWVLLAIVCIVEQGSPLGA